MVFVLFFHFLRRSVGPSSGGPYSVAVHAEHRTGLPGHLVSFSGHRERDRLLPAGFLDARDPDGSVQRGRLFRKGERRLQY